MTEEKKGGMSKGCMVGLIVGGILALIIIIGGIVLYLNCDNLARMPVQQVTTMMKTQLAENPPEGVDAEQFTTVTDSFMVRLEAEDPLDYEKYAPFIQSIQTLASKEEFTAEDFMAVEDAMVNYYPELGELRAPAVDEMMDETTEEMGEEAPATE